MTIRLIPWLIAIGTACTGLAAHAAGTAHSLDQVPGKFSSPDARAAYAREMSGAPEPDWSGRDTAPSRLASFATGADPIALPSLAICRQLFPMR